MLWASERNLSNRERKKINSICLVSCARERWGKEFNVTNMLQHFSDFRQFSNSMERSFVVLLSHSMHWSVTCEKIQLLKFHVCYFLHTQKMYIYRADCWFFIKQEREKIYKLTIGCCGCSFMTWAVDDGICWMFTCCCCCGCCAVWMPIKLVCCCWFACAFWVFGDGCGTAAGAGLADACWSCFVCCVRGDTTPPKFNALRPR